MPSARVLVVYGTRPEAVKLAPVVLALQDDPDLETVTCVTAQHREMLDQVNELFGIRPDVDLDLMRDRQSIEALTAAVLTGCRQVIEDVQPSAVVVQGDTTTSFAAALAAFYAQVPVVHVEARLRTHDRYAPFPEEINRRLTTQLASLHLAPTAGNRANLLAEGVDDRTIIITGNTVVDALLHVAGRLPPVRGDLADVLSGEGPLLLVTAHRRESWGEPLAAVGRALRVLTERHRDLHVLLPAHRNPAVREALLPPLKGLGAVTVVEPLDYPDFVHALRRATLVLTDSGGVQEEAPSLGRPVLVMRTVTERPEAVVAGTVALVGTDTGAIVDAVTELLTDPDRYRRMAVAANPYGDGRAAPRSVQAIRHLLLGDRPPSAFEPAGAQ